jgi:DNA-directed RNA polymerase specialized sigma24 family protein
MADSDAPLARGDEADLFRAYNTDLMRDVARVVHTSTAQTIEDACSFAWAQFLEHQPDRELNWRGWLFRTAQRQAWLLEGERQETPLRVTETSYVPHTFEAASPIDDFQLRDDVEEALSIVRELPPRLKHIAMLRALGFKYDEIGALTGDSPSRTHRLVVNATERVWQIIAERAHTAVEHASPRAERLWDLEHHPPVWSSRRSADPSV